MKITYLGHSAFEFNIDDNKILVDPFLICSPDYKINNVSDIFVTHGHCDHLGSSIEISKKYNSKITAIFELANYCLSKGANVQGVGLGSWLKYSFGKVIFLPAFHSSSSQEGIYTGNAAGILFEIDGKRIFHAGDTCLNSEMKLLKEIYKPDVAILPVGGVFTMDIEQALIASDWIGADVIVPMHYNTFPQIKVNIDEFKQGLLSKNKTPLILQVGEEYNI